LTNKKNYDILIIVLRGTEETKNFEKDNITKQLTNRKVYDIIKKFGNELNIEN
jgi:hypothetical protein